MRYTYLLILLSVVACGTEVPVDQGPPCDGLAGEPIQSTDFDPDVTKWGVYDCAPDQYRIEDGSVLAGYRRGFNESCLLSSPTLDLSDVPPSGKVCISLNQRGGPSWLHEVPFHTHLFVRFDRDPELKDEQLHRIPFTINKDKNVGDWVVETVVFNLPVNARSMDLVWGVSSPHISPPITPQNMPSVWLRRAEVLSVR